MVREGKAVWLMESGDYDSSYVVGVYTSRSEWDRVEELHASGIRDLPNGMSFAILDEPVPRPRGCFVARIGASGEIFEESQWRSFITVKEPHTEIRSLGNHRGFVGYGKTKEDAMRSAEEFRSVTYALGDSAPQGPIAQTPYIGITVEIIEDDITHDRTEALFPRVAEALTHAEEARTSESEPSPG